MRTIVIAVFLVVGIQLSKAQELIIKDRVSIEFVKAKVVSKSFNARSSIKVKGKGIERVMVRCKMKSLSGQPVDINAFSLIDTVNKVRYRISEYMSYKGVSVMGSGYSSEKYLVEELKDKKGKPYKGLPKYDSTIHDSFSDYNIEGYKNVEAPIKFGINRNFSTAEAFDKKKDLISAVYYAPTKLKEFTSEMYFIVFTDLEFPPVLEFHYGYEKITEVFIK